MATELIRPDHAADYVEELRGRHRESFVFLREVLALTGLPDTYIRSLIARGAFPTPVRLDGRRQSFVLGEVLDWLDRVKSEKRQPTIRADMAAAVKRGGKARAEQRKAETAE
jgi:predicted DNA-binding transcriptional regulator AlpA